jgi:hypothetical protein
MAALFLAFICGFGTALILIAWYQGGSHVGG